MLEEAPDYLPDSIYTAVEPAVEKSLQGPHRGFSHSLAVNLKILQDQLNAEQLKLETVTLEGKIKNSVVVAFFEEQVERRIIDPLLTKIGSLQGSNITGIGQLEQLLKAYPISPFPQLQTTGRLDKVIQALCNGQLVIFMDGSPTVLIGPVSLFSFLETPEDLQVNWLYYPLVRIVRIIALIAGVILPAFYVAIVTFHYYVIPLNFILPLIESRFRVPFPPIVEALIMALILEMIYELLSRLTSRIGTGLSLIAIILIGTAIAYTGFISSFLIFVNGIVNICLLVLPLYDLGFTIRILRFGALIFAALFGMLGLAVFSSLTFVHVLSLQSLGEPYFHPLVPFNFKKLITFFLRPIKRLPEASSGR